MIQLRHWLEQATLQLSPHSDTARLDAEILLLHELGKPRAFLFTAQNEPLSSQIITRLNTLLSKRMAGEPIAYIIGHQPFYNVDLMVNSDVLIPRSDTEILVELALNTIETTTSPNILDLGTGSGAIALAIGKARSDASVLAVDACPKAISIATKNIQHNHINNVSISYSNWFKDITPQLFDLIVSNPPYIAQHDPHLEQTVFAYEPEKALISSQNGLKDLTTIISESPNWLKPSGWLLVEHGWEQQESVRNLFNQYDFRSVTGHRDLAKNPRVVCGRKSLDEI